MASSMQLLWDRSCRFANNKLGRKNQWRYFFCTLYQVDEPLHGSTPYSEADQGNSVWDVPLLLRERAKETDRHGNASHVRSKVATTSMLSDSIAVTLLS